MPIAIRTAAELAEAVRRPLDNVVSGVLLDHVARLSEYEGHSLEELAHFLIVTPGDQLPEVNRSLGFDLNIATPEYVDRHDGWYELVVVVSDGGFGWVALIKDDPGVGAEILNICRNHAQPG